MWWSRLRIITLATIFGVLLCNAQQCNGFLPAESMKNGNNPPNGGLRSLTALSASSNQGSPLMKDLSVVIAGAGPSGLFLAHHLLQQGANVSIHDCRPDPRSTDEDSVSSGRAYALGLGIRGRTALQDYDPKLWEAIHQRGKDCDRFRLHIGPLKLKIRDSVKGQTPTLLIFQSELCSALLDSLEECFGNSNHLELQFQSCVTSCDLTKRQITVQTATNETQIEPYDLLVGCDGVHSVVRNALEQAVSPPFSSQKYPLPGSFKTVRIDHMPPPLDPNSVAAMVAIKQKTLAVVVPGSEKGPKQASILFISNAKSESDSNLILDFDDNIVNDSNNSTLPKILLQTFPLLEGIDLNKVADQLVGQKARQGSSIVCNAYHYRDSVALVGDAAKACAGGVGQGQGANTALQDASVLTECLVNCFRNMESTTTSTLLQSALNQYSKQRVPEGKALYDLSFGPKPKGLKKKLGYIGKGIRDTVFKGRYGIGKKPLRERLTTTMEPISNIRRQLDRFYEEPFPDDASFDKSIDSLYSDH